MTNTRIVPHPPLDPIAYETEVYQKGLRYERPSFTFDSTQWETLAKDRLSAEAWGYVYGSAGTAETKNKNLAAFKKWSIVPSRLHGQATPDLSVEVFGEKVPFPIALAPVGVQTLFHREGEWAAARAAAAEPVPFIHSTAAAASFEDIAKANGDGLRWYQLYWPKMDMPDLTISLLKRAKAAGFKVLFVTLDTYVLGWRPMDMDNGYNPFLRADHVGAENGLTDPAFQEHFKAKSGGKSIGDDLQAACAEWAHSVFPFQDHSWEDIKFLQQHWDGPIVLKGIQSVADAKRAKEAGVQGIVVSNHGGRQQDGGVASLDMLPRIADAVGDKLEVFFDSGVRCGADIVKALALGAKMVLIGRPYIYGLALGGQAGVEHVIKSLLGETELTMHLAGVKSVRELDRDLLVREPVL